MKRSILAALILCAAGPVHAADDAVLTRMALCQDSWLDWSKSDPARMKGFVQHVGASFKPHGNDPYLLPRASVSAMGLRVVQLFPQSVGMGVGFSLTVDAPFDAARKTVEKALGKTLQHCEVSDGMKSCDLELAPQRSVMLTAAGNPKSHQTLVGCFYLYEK